MAQNQTLGRGEVHFSLFKEGTYEPTGFRYIGNTPEFNLTAASEQLAHYSMDRGTRVKDRSVNLQTDHTGTFTCDDISLENLALFFLGSSGIVAQAAASDLSETFEDVKLGHSYQLGVTTATPTGVRDVTITTITAGATPLVAGTDYTLDASRGIITILADAVNVTEGADVAVSDYEVGAVSFNRMVSGSQKIEGAIRFDAYNAEGDQIDYHMHLVTLSPNGDLPLKGDDWMTLPFNVEIGRRDGFEPIYANGQPYTA